MRRLRSTLALAACKPGGDATPAAAGADASAAAATGAAVPTLDDREPNRADEAIVRSTHRLIAKVKSGARDEAQKAP